MVQDEIIEIRLTGEGIKPGNIKSKDIGELIQSLEEAIVSLVISQNPQLQKEQIIVGLSSIVDQSIDLRFCSNLEPLVIPAFEQVAYAISSSRYFDLPANSVKSLRKISSFIKNHKCNAEFYARNGTFKQLATLTPETEIPPTIYIQGETVLYGEITRAGGKEPRIQFTTIGNELVHCTTTKEIAIQAGTYLYKQVGLVGVALWDAKTLALEDFTVTQIIEYGPMSLNEAFNELAEFLKPDFDEVNDVNQFVHHIRYGVVEE